MAKKHIMCVRVSCISSVQACNVGDHLRLDAAIAIRSG
jgi:hypothetical protein